MHFNIRAISAFLSCVWILTWPIVASATQQTPSTIDVLFANNVAGEIEPCG